MTHTIPPLDEVDRIATHPEAVIRNLQITQCYYELSSVMAERMTPMVNWCTFATWASKQAGQTIRKEDLGRALEHLLKAEPNTAEAALHVATTTRESGIRRETDFLRQTVWEALNPAAVMERASEAVARGNQKVFEEIGREFARFLLDFMNDTTLDAEKIARFCETLQDGDPPNGQGYLRRAFAHYYQAFFESNPKTRTELILLANIEIGFHEQTRLQPEIAEALEAAIIDPGKFALRYLEVIFPYRGWFFYGILLLMRLFRRTSKIDDAIQSLITLARKQARLFLTELMMGLEFPNHLWLRLSQDLPGKFPAELQTIHAPELKALLTQVDPTPDSLHETGAVDWADLPDRLHFIVDLFRCYAMSPDLLKPPFTPEQIAEIKAGNLPGGRL